MGNKEKPQLTQLCKELFLFKKPFLVVFSLAIGVIFNRNFVLKALHFRENLASD